MWTLTVLTYPQRCTKMQIVVAETYSKAQLHAKYVVSRKLHAKNMTSRKVQGTVGMRRDSPRTAGGNPLEMGSGAVRCGQMVPESGRGYGPSFKGVGIV